MASLRYEFLLDPHEGGIRSRDPIGGGTLVVTSTPTSGGARPVVPNSGGQHVLAVFESDAPVYIDIGSAPDPTIVANATLVEPGQTIKVDVYAGDIISAVLASDIGAGSPAEASTVPGSLSGLNLLSTQASGSRIGRWFFQNQSAVSLTVALDDGAGNALSVFVIAPGAGAGQQGGSMGWADTGPHTGRIRVYGAAASQHALRVQ